MKRVLTRLEEEALRNCHHDHGGKSIKEAAVSMGRSTRAVQRLLNNASKKTPQMFPILTPRHRTILLMYDEHLSRKTIMAALNLTAKVLRSEVEFLRKHKFLFDRTCTMNQYRPSMDGQVKEKF